MTLNQIGTLQSVIVVFEKSTRAQDRAAAGIPPGAEQRRQTENVANGHAASGVALQSVIHADEGGRVRRVFVRDALDGGFRNSRDLADARRRIFPDTFFQRVE